MQKPEIPSQLATDMKLHYVSGKENGYSRSLKGGKFCYHLNKNLVKDVEVIQRIHALVIPPAWTDVWICRWKNGHIQATGIDARGRKQYRYHSEWASRRNLTKFDRLEGFANKLGLLKKQLAIDLRKRQFSKEKVCAIAVDTVSKTFIRVGNKAYEREYGSFGLTTLKNAHVNIESNKIFFKFKGKKGVMQKIYLKESKTAKLLKNVKEIPGQKLFQYYDADGSVQQLDSGDINAYLKDSMHDDYTCKDFRTWAGCLLCLMVMSRDPFPETATERKKELVSIIDQVAERLGNTRTVTRNYYIHPALQERYLDGSLAELIKKLNKKQEHELPGTHTEKAFVSFLKSLKKS
ncbi:DNA topoisomerase IB [Sphingobacterium hungaricum]|uniref:DNA topoisomerase I n=1 Tax=Sphingobacterium hungaricum TaxID=2082723 RepID=A0A928UYQ8_9SPHI|nr:DNA topoisomerase IB [Sphingobacterium hungaricum]MBE8715147.1 DNA topoisomerase I [Sphingobacterium hungaricum]